MRVTAANFFGFGLNAVDAKSRLSIPADFRATLASRGSAREVLIGPGHAGRPCLMAYDPDFSEALRQQVKARHADPMSVDAYADNTALAGFMQKTAIDDAGRVVMSAQLKRQGGIGSHVWFIAGFDYFELWDPWTFLAQPGLTPVQRAVVEGELEARGLPLERPA
jgi:MraZ protein